MAQRTLVVGLDIGSASIRTLIAHIVPEEEAVRVIGVGAAPSSGIRRGTIVDVEEALKALNASIEQAERMAGVAVERAFISVSGTEIFSQESKGVVAVGKADGEVLEDDVERVLEAAQSVPVPLNKEILHVVPKSYRLDDQKNIKDPIGMHGVRLEVEALVIGGLSPHLKNITRCLEQANIASESFVVEPLAAAEAVLNRKQKELGVAMINIGNSVTSVAVFEDGDLLHIKVLPIGAAHVTNDIAIGLRTSIEVAEQVKLRFGNALAREIGKEEEIDLEEIDSAEEGTVSRYHVAEIIEARLEEIFHFVNNELKSIGRAGLLPAGVVLTGGGSKLPGVVDLAKETVRLPAQVGYPKTLGGILDKVDDPEFATVVGLVLWAQEHQPVGSGTRLALTGWMNPVLQKLQEWLKKFLP